MAKTVGQIRINLTAGTAQFLVDMDKANAKITQFGQNTKAAGGHAVSGVQAASGAIRTLEGNVQNNVRAVERFLVTTLHLGPVLQAAFPVIGAIAFGGLIVKLGQEVKEFYTGIRDGSEKVKGAYAQLTAPLRTSNAELDVTNDRLRNQIAILEGRRENTLKLALDEARAAAGKLAEELQRDLNSLNKLLTDNQTGFFSRKLLGGSDATEDVRKYIGGETGYGGKTGAVADIFAQANQKIADISSNAKTDTQKVAARKQIDAISTQAQADANRELSDAINKANGELKKQEAILDALENHGGLLNGKPLEGHLYNRALIGKDIELLKGTVQGLQEMQRAIPKRLESVQLTLQKETLESSGKNAKLDQPFDNKILELQSRLASARAQLNSAGGTEVEKAIAQAEGEALKAIEEVDRALRNQSAQSKGLTEEQKGTIRSVLTTKALTELETQRRDKLTATTASIRDQVRGQELLTAAIGKGYEAVKRANVEVEVMRRVGPENYNDKGFMDSHQTDIAKIRADAETEYEARHRQELATTADSLNDQIGLEMRLAQVQSQGAAAIRLATLQYNLELLKQKGATQDILDKRKALFDLEEKNRANAEIDKINLEIEAVKRLNAAELEGAEAVRKAKLENKYAAMKAEGALQPEAMGEAIQKERQNDDQAYELQMRQLVGQRVLAYQNQLEALNLEKAYLQANLGLYGNTRDAVQALADIEDERLRIVVKQQLAQRDAMSGIRAFFLEMQQQSKSTAQSMYEALNSTVDRFSDNMSRALTGQKTAWSQMFKDIGAGLLRDTIKSNIQKQLGSVAKSIPGLGPLAQGLAGKPDGTAANPIHVIVAGGANAVSSTAGAITSIPGVGKVLGKLGGIFGGAGQGAEIFSGDLGGMIFNALPGRAMGGDVYPGMAYVVGERGPELFRTAVAGHITSNAESRRVAQGPAQVWNIGPIDARGTDPVLTEMRVRAAIETARVSSVSTSVQATIDRGRRTVSKL